MTSVDLGFAGTAAGRFLRSKVTLLLGAFAIAVPPREEEPQINVTFANIFIPYPGATAEEVENLVSTPAEQVLSKIVGIDPVYSDSRPGMAVLTIRYLVGEDREDAIVRLYNKIFSNSDWLPYNLGVGEPIIKPKGIDDVPIVTLTLWKEDPERGSHDLLQVAHALEAELKRVPGIRNIYIVGGPDRLVHVLFNPERLSGFGLSLDDLRQALTAGNTSRENGTLVRENREIRIQAGDFLTTPEEVGQVMLGVHNLKPIYLGDVPEVREGPDQPESSVWFGTGPHPVRILGLRLHPEPCHPVRADLFDRYPGGRCDRGGGEYPLSHAAGREVSA